MHVLSWSLGLYRLGKLRVMILPLREDVGAGKPRDMEYLTNTRAAEGHS